MKLLIIGQSVVDDINYEGVVSLKPGGIHYSIAGISSFLKDDDEVFLCSNLTKKDEYLFQYFYSKINTKYVEFVNKIPTVHLTIHPDKERDERYENITSNLNIPLSDIQNFDGVYINMITGYDINLEQLKKIRENFNKEIYFDVHTFSRGLDEKGNRNFRRIENFDEWAKLIDIIQMNEEEIKTVSQKTTEFEIVSELLSIGIKQVIITKAEKGVRIFYKSDNELESYFITGAKVKTKNKVGCGDVFGAVYFYNYIRTKNLFRSLAIANLAAGFAATYEDLKEFRKLYKDVQQQYS